MAQYRVKNQAVEIGGTKTYQPGDVVDESVFRPAPELTEAQIADGIVAKSEVESLLSTGHIEAI